MSGIMKAFIVFSAVLLCAFAQEENEKCYKDAVEACASTNKPALTSLEHCNARYGGIAQVEGDLQAYVNTYISRSFEYLMMATHYANYIKNREGFEKLFRGLSDNTWHEAIELIQYITKRGGSMDFNNRKFNPTYNATYELYELESLAKALDIQKQLATQAHSIHARISKERMEHHDPEIASHIEEEFTHKHASTIRKLSGYTNDLKRLLKTPDNSLALFLFDEYLQKQ